MTDAMFHSHDHVPAWKDEIDITTMRKKSHLYARKAGPLAWRQEACWTDCLINGYINGWHLIAKSWTA
eukprot:4213633-Karenia_brevis.AAC.1